MSNENKIKGKLLFIFMNKKLLVQRQNTKKIECEILANLNTFTVCAPSDSAL